MRKVFYFALFLLLSACSSSVYRTVNETSFDSENDKPVFRKLIFLSSQRFPECDYLIKIINKQNWRALDEYQHRFHIDKNDNILRSVKSLIQRQYLQSNQYLSSLPDSSFNSQALIMKIDCLHELHVDSINYYQSYQRAFDESKNIYVKKIAQKRYRFYTHGY